MDQWRAVHYQVTLGCNGKNDLVILNTAVEEEVGLIQNLKLGSKFIETVRVTHRTYSIPPHKLHEHNMRET